jgi:hypothetical protein
VGDGITNEHDFGLDRIFYSHDGGMALIPVVEVFF